MVGKRVTSQDVAKKAGVSRTTVSFVLNNVPNTQISEETRQRVFEAARDLGYVPDAAAQALASRRSQTVGLVIVRSSQQVAADAFLNLMLNGLVVAAQAQGLCLLVDILQPEHKEQDYLNLVRGKRIDGLILAGPRFDDQALQSLEESQCPTVLIGESPSDSFGSVDVNNRAAAAMAVAHLIKLGHTHIGCITNAHSSYADALERMKGYRDGLQAAGLPFDEHLVRWGDFDPESGRRQMASLLDEAPEMTAVFVASDVVAMGAMAAVAERGIRIPEDIAIVGFDDVLLSQFLVPPLTTVHLPAYDLGYQAVSLLGQMIRREPPPTLRIRLDTQLVVRLSCGAAVRKQPIE
jgi:LacI family transcriptional regulator